MGNKPPAVDHYENFPLRLAASEAVSATRVGSPPAAPTSSGSETSTFEQDVTETRYEDFGEPMSYLRRLANPVGRLLLHLFDGGDARSLAYSIGFVRRYNSSTSCRTRSILDKRAWLQILARALLAL